MPPVYRGPFGKPQAERLLWRAGFGPRPGEAERLASARARARRPLVDAPRSRAPARAEAARRPRAAAGALRRLGARPALVARPDGAHEPAAGRADDARLARLVRDLGRDQQRAADHPPEQPLPKARARLVLDPAPGRHPRPGDAALALRDRQHQGLAQRELRARADGALHARRRPRRLHRARRARAGTGADRLAQRLERQPRPGQLPLRQAPPRPRREDDLRQARPLRLAATRAACASSTGCTRPSS